MLSWQIGEVRIQCVVELVAESPITRAFVASVAPDELAPHLHWLQPAFLTDDLRTRVAVQSMLIESRDTRIVVDTCFGNDRQSAIRSNLQTDYLDRLADAGFGRDEVDVVLCTHLHIDHVGWNTMLVDNRWEPTFPRAWYLFAADEFEYWRAHDHVYVDLADTVLPIVEAGRHRLVDARFEITDEVRLLPTPGHTPGHVSVAISSGGEHALITGDALAHPIQIVDPTWPLRHEVDIALANKTRQQLLAALEGTATLLIGTHFPEPTAGYVRRTEAGLLEPGTALEPTHRPGRR